MACISILWLWLKAVHVVHLCVQCWYCTAEWGTIWSWLSYGSATVHGMALWCEDWLTWLGLGYLVGWLNHDLGLWLL